MSSNSKNPDEISYYSTSAPEFEAVFKNETESKPKIELSQSLQKSLSLKSQQKSLSFFKPEVSKTEKYVSNFQSNNQYDSDKFDYYEIVPNSGPSRPSLSRSQSDRSWTAFATSIPKTYANMFKEKRAESRASLQNEDHSNAPRKEFLRASSSFSAPVPVIKPKPSFKSRIETLIEENSDTEMEELKIKESNTNKIDTISSQFKNESELSKPKSILVKSAPIVFSSPSPILTPIPTLISRPIQYTTIVQALPPPPPVLGPRLFTEFEDHLKNSVKKNPLSENTNLSTLPISNQTLTRPRTAHSRSRLDNIDNNLPQEKSQPYIVGKEILKKEKTVLDLKNPQLKKKKKIRFKLPEKRTSIHSAKSVHVDNLKSAQKTAFRPYFDEEAQVIGIQCFTCWMSTFKEIGGRCTGCANLVSCPVYCWLLFIFPLFFSLAICILLSCLIGAKIISVI